MTHIQRKPRKRTTPPRKKMTYEIQQDGRWIRPTRGVVRDGDHLHYELRDKTVGQAPAGSWRLVERSDLDPQARPEVADEQQATRSSRDAIAKLYGHGTKIVSGSVMTPLVIGPGATVEDIEKNDHKVLASDIEDAVHSSVNKPATTTSDTQENKTMATVTMTYKGLSKSKKYALYAGLRTVTRMSVTDFPDSKPPQTFQASGEFAGPREIKAKRLKLSADELKQRREQRKQERASRPKPTLAEKLALEEKRFQERKAKIEAKIKAEAAQPELVAQ